MTYGRTLWNTTAFPHFLEMIQHIHANGQKVGIYLLPGLGTSVYAANLPIFGTQYHAQDIAAQPLNYGQGFGYGYKIDFTKPGAQEYINSLVNLYASWGIDFIKLDGVTPGSYNDNLNINNIPDVQGNVQSYCTLSGRPIWLTLSWALEEDYLSDWQQNSERTPHQKGTSSARATLPESDDRMAACAASFLRSDQGGRTPPARPWAGTISIRSKSAMAPLTALRILSNRPR